MSDGGKLKSAAGMIAAPWLFVASSAIRSPALLRWTLACDPRYARAEERLASDWGAHAVVGQLRIATTLASLTTAEAAGRLKKALASSESQILQDLFCLFALDEKRNGYFVEVGVGNGTAISNTYMLERDFGWTGLLVEPNASSHASIRASRAAALETRAASSAGGQSVLFQEVVGDGEYSRLSGAKGHDGRGSGVREYKVETATLTEMLEQNRAPQDIDYLSLDTEGHEYEILIGTDLSRYRFKVMTIEHNFDHERLRKIEALIRPYGYRRVLTHLSSFDAWYLHADVRPKSMPGLD